MQNLMIVSYVFSIPSIFNMFLQIINLCFGAKFWLKHSKVEREQNEIFRNSGALPGASLRSAAIDVCLHNICKVYSSDEFWDDMVRSTLLRHCFWGALRANLGCLIFNIKNTKFWRLFAKSDDYFLCFQHSEHI